MRRVAIVKRESRSNFSYRRTSDPASIRTLGGVICRTRCSMKFGRGGAARSGSASTRAGLEHAVAANTGCDVVSRCRCSPLSIANSNRSSLLRPLGRSSWSSFHKRDRSPRRAAIPRAARPACGPPLLLLSAWRSGPPGRYQSPAPTPAHRVLPPGTQHVLRTLHQQTS